MKLNKLLTPILGLATVSTVAAPLATSCTSETTDHIKISNKSEEVTCNSSGLASYLFVLDAHDYDVHGFKVSTTVDSKDTTGVVSSDFETTWEIDGDHLIVKVQYVGEEAPEDDVTIKLNIHINYGTAWNKTFDVKFDYAVDSGIVMEWDKTNEYFYYPDGAVGIKKGESYKIVLDFSKITSTKVDITGYSYFWPVMKEQQLLPRGVGAYFEDITMVVDGETLIEETHYTLYKGALSGYYEIDLLPAGWQKIGENSKITISFKNCTGIYLQDETTVDSYNCYPKFL